MTTHVLSGFSVTYDNNDNVTAVGSATLSLRFNDNVTSFTYSVDGAPGPGDLPDIVVSPDPEDAVMNGAPVPMTSEESLGYIVTPAGTTQIFAVEFGGTDYIFQIGGVHLTEPTTVAEMNALEASITDAGQSTGAYAPGQPITLSTIPGHSSFEAEVIDGTPGPDVLLGGMGDDTIDGMGGDDYIDGGDGDDMISLGEGSPYIAGSAGSDTIDFSNVLNGYIGLDYFNFGVAYNSAIDVTINGVTNTGSIEKIEEGSGTTLGTDTIVDVDNPLYSGWTNGGLGLTGTQYDDTFDLTIPYEGWMQVRPGAGADVITVTGGSPDHEVRVDYREMTGNMVVDLSQGKVLNDGTGSVDTINGYIWEIATGSGNDSVLGTASDESFILGGGTDTLDGGDGFDRIRYGVSGEDAGIVADLDAGTITGSANGTAFSHSVTSIEYLRGTNYGDSMSGGAEDNRLRGHGGDDTLIGKGGNDTLEGDNGNDSLSGGDGHDLLMGGQGDDSLYGGLGDDTLIGGDGDDYLNPGDSAGSSETEYDVVLPGRGVNTVDFSQVLNGYVSVDTRDVADSLAQGGLITINGVTNSGSIVYTPGVHETIFADVKNPLLSGWSTGGLSIKDSNFSDVYDITLDANQWMQVQANALGSSTYNVSGPLAVRIDYGGLYTAINANLVTGEIDKGSGNIDTINGSIWEVRGGGAGDTMLGTGADEGFIGGGGNDMMDGGGGFDRLRYSHDSYDSGITMNMNAGSVFGSWQGFAFTDTVSNMEHLVGSQHDDLMLGNDSVDELIDGDLGDDTIDGGGGNDTLEGGSGADTFVFGAGDGNDAVTDFDIGTDMLDVSSMGLTQGELNAVYRNATDTGGGGQIDYGNGTVVTFEGLTAAELAALAGANSKPSLTVENQTLVSGDFMRLNSVWTFTDADGDPLQKVRVFDDTGANSWWVDGGFVDASTGTGVETSNPDQIWFYGEASAGAQTLWVSGYDGFEWGAWDTFTLTTVAPNTKPVLTVEDQTTTPGTYVRLNEVWNYSDLDGDTLQKVQVFDNSGANSWWVDGGLVDASTGSGVETSNLGGVWFQGEPSAGTQTLWVRGFDGTEWGAWDTFELTTSDNTKPVLTVEDQSVAPGAYTSLDSVWTYSDADGDTLQKVQVFDNTGADSWWVDGGFVSAGTGSGFETSNPDQIRFYGEATEGNQTLWVRGHDGTEWGAWDTFTLTTEAPNTKPVLTVEDQSVATGAYIRLNAVFDFTDADGDSLEKVQVKDDTGADSWWIGNSFVDASTGDGAIADNPDQVWFYGEATAGMQILSVRGFDGTDWSDWDTFELTTF